MKVRIVKRHGNSVEIDDVAVVEIVSEHSWLELWRHWERERGMWKLGFDPAGHTVALTDPNIPDPRPPEVSA